MNEAAARAAAMQRHPAGKARHMPLIPPAPLHGTDVTQTLADRLFEATVPRDNVSIRPTSTTVTLTTKEAGVLLGYIRDLQQRTHAQGHLYAAASDALDRVRKLAQDAIDLDLMGEADIAALDVIAAIVTNPLPSETTE